MPPFQYVAGALIEVQRYINVPARWCEQYPARERRELWIERQDECRSEIKLVVHSRAMPARRGHQVCVLLRGDMVLGLANLTTGRQVNFVRADPPLLIQRCDTLVVFCLLLVGALLAAFWEAHALVLAIPLALLYVPIRAAGRLLWRVWMHSAVDRGLSATLAGMQAESPRLRRVR